MNRKEMDQIIRDYNARLDRYGGSEASLGWTKNRQFLRFEMLIDEFRGLSGEILDFGCGFADMYHFLKEKQFEFSYHGVDINQRLLDVALEKYPGVNVEKRDILKEGLDRQYDYIFSSGVHNVKTENPEKFLRDTFSLFYQHSRKGFSVNFLSDRVGFPTVNSQHTSPLMVLELAYSFTNRVILRNDYMPFEFTIYVFKDDKFNPNKVVYSDFEHLVK